MDLKYNFLQDTEPSEEQLEILMREVAADAQKRREAADERFQQLIHEEVKLAAERSQAIIKNTVQWK